jgi:hypothetical protein
VAGERTQLANPGLIGRQCNCVVGVGVEDDAGGRQRVDGTTADVSSRAHYAPFARRTEEALRVAMRALEVLACD